MPTTTATLRWAGGFRFEGTGIYGHPIATDAVKSAGGAESGHKPTELLLWAIASCTGSDVVSILAKQRQKLTSLEIAVTAENNEQYPRPFHTINITYKATGHQLDPLKLQQAIELSESKYCIVSQTIQQSAKVHTHFEIQEATSSDSAVSEEVKFTPLAATLHSPLSVASVSANLQTISLAHGFRTLAVHNVQETLAEKGFERGELQVVEVCNAAFAHEVLMRDMNVALFMPCRFSVYQDNSGTVVSLARPSMIAQLLPQADLGKIVNEVEQKLITIMKEAVR